MTNIEKLKELLDKMNKANSAYSNERHIGGTLLEDFSRAENRLCESAIAMLPALLAVAEAADNIECHAAKANCNMLALVDALKKLNEVKL